MAETDVAVVGLRALVRDLTKAADDRAGPLLAFLQAAGREAAAPVALAARSALPHDSGTLSGDVRVTGGRTGAAVRMGRIKVPYAGWVDFGGTRHRPHVSTRDFVKTGRYLFPSARGLSEQSARIYAAALDRGFAAMGWTNTTGDGNAVHD
jgi:hypothetical protein